MRRFIRRTRAVAHKEVLHILRDARAVYMALGLPVVMLMLFGYGISQDVDHFPMAVVDQDRTPASRRLFQALVAGGDLSRELDLPSPDEGEAALRSGRVKAVLVVPEGYGRALTRGLPAAAQILVDGSDGTTATIAMGDAAGIVEATSAARATRPSLNAGPRVRVRFNPAMRSAYNMVSGVIVLILAMVASLLTALTIAREWERGTMEQLFATPVSRLEIIVGKLIPYTGLGFVQTLLVLTLGSYMFDIPIRGSLVTLFGCSTLFLLAMLGTGLIASVLAKSQLVAVQFALMVAYMPVAMLSGFMFPIDNMPWWLQGISRAVPGRYYLTTLRGVLLKGNGLALLARDAVTLAVFAAALLAVAVWRFRRRLSVKIVVILLSLLNVMKKELCQTLRDRRMLATLIVAPILQLVVFGYAIDLDVDRIPTVVCDQDATPASRDLTQAFFADRTFLRGASVLDPSLAEDALEGGGTAAALIIPHGFARRVARADAPEVQLLVDGTDAVRAQIAVSAASQFLLLHGIGGEPGAPPAAFAVSLAPRVMYNQRLKSAVYMLPGVLATLLLNVTAIVTAMGMARERETGTLEQILVTPIRPVVFLAGKCLPYILFGLVDILAVLLLGNLVFDVPFRGSFGVVALGSFLYLFSTLGIGILIATLSSSQPQAMLGAFAFMLPAMLLSGFMSPISSMPAWLRPFTMLNPIRHFIEIMRGCLLKGAGVRDLAQQMTALAVLGIGILGISIVGFRKRLT